MGKRHLHGPPGTLRGADSQDGDPETEWGATQAAADEEAM